MSKSPAEVPGFRNPPLWIHVSEALLAPREARKRAIIRVIDKVKTAKVAVANPKPKI